MDPADTPPHGKRAALLLARVGEPAARELAALAELDDVLEKTLQRARGAWPALTTVNDEDFVVYLAERLASAPDPARALLGVHAEDLFLACACARGDQRAMAELESRHFADARQAVMRSEPSAANHDEVMQLLREKVFVAHGEQAPKIAQYSGRGPLSGWLRMAAIRTAFSLRRAGKRDAGAAGDDRLLEIPSRESNPELAQMKATYQAEFKEAFQSALGSLTARDRNVLRLQFIDGLNIDEVGAMYRVHRSTVARWVARAKEQLLEETRRLMTERLRLTHSEFDSLMGLVRSQLDVSLVRFLDE